MLAFCYEKTVLIFSIFKHQPPLLLLFRFFALVDNFLANFPFKLKLVLHEAKRGKFPSVDGNL